MSENDNDNDQQGTSRRRFLTGAGAGAAALTLPGLLAACGDDGGGGTAGGGGGGGGGGSGLPDGLKVGYVTPRTGALAPFGEADDFVLAQMREELGIDIVDKDSESDSSRAAEAAQELILQDGVHVVLVSSTPDTTVPVAQQCDVNGVPCISTVAPWQPHYIGLGGVPPEATVASDFNFHFFWGLEDVIEVFLDMWDQSGVSKVVGGLWPNDPDGNAWSDPELGFPPPLQAAGYEVVDPGRFPLNTNDFSAQISAFRDAGVEIVSGVLIPPDFGNFQAQALQQGFNPPVVTVGKALLFPSAVESYPQGAGLTSEVWWTDRHPFTSSVTSQSCQELAQAFEDASGGQWTQPLGFAHALFEVAVDALTRAGSTEVDAITGALAETNLATIVGTVDFSAGPVPNLSKTLLVGGQWVEGTDFPLELQIVANTQIPEVDVAGEIALIG